MSRSNLKIVLIGECMIELQANTSDTIRRSYAGDTLNTAIYLARLAGVHGAQVDYMTALGKDEFSNEMILRFQNEGIGCEEIRQLDNKLPGLYFVQVDDKGERSFSYWRGESAAKDLFKPETQPSVSTLADYDFIYLSGISLAILDTESRNRLLELLQKARQLGSKICFDNNYRPRLWNDIEETQIWYKQILRLTDYAFLTFDDEQAVWSDSTPEQTLARYDENQIQNLIIKCGSEPCVIRTPSFTGSIPAKKIPAEQVIDTNAAGDSFSAGYLCGLLKETERPAINAEIGHLVAGTVIQHKGAVIERSIILDLHTDIQKLI